MAELRESYHLDFVSDERAVFVNSMRFEMTFVFVLRHKFGGVIAATPEQFPWH